jgi:hypothetical protein
MGGAIFNAAGSVTITNSTLAGNAADGGNGLYSGTAGGPGSGLGGALFNLNGSVTLNNATLALNSVAAGAQAGGLTGLATGGALFSLGLNGSPLYTSFHSLDHFRPTIGVCAQ